MWKDHKPGRLPLMTSHLDKLPFADDRLQAETLERWGVQRCDAVDRAAFNAGLSALIEIDGPAGEAPQRRLDRLRGEEGEAVRQRLEEAVALARTGDRAHRTDDQWPHGLVDELYELLQDLEAHDAHEAFARSAENPASAPLRAGLRQDHEALAARLEELRRLTAGYEAPPHACAVWRLLYVLCLKVDRALVERIRLEEAGNRHAAPQSYGALILSADKVPSDAAA